MRFTIHLGLAVAAAGAAIPSPSSAQTNPIASRTVATNLASGAFDNPTSAHVVVFEQLVAVDGAPWLRLRFDAAELPGTSYVELVSLRDGGLQRLDREGMLGWENHSAYFNGDAVFVRLVAGPHSRGSRIAMRDLQAGVDPPVPPTVCGTDDRTLSTDRRIARVMSVGCTAWLINRQNLLISAGHCCGSSFQTVQFNVPPSTSTGALQHPPPEDQYPVNVASKRTGSDWCLFQTLANSTTGQHAGQRQGASFLLSLNDPPIGATIRITGFGTVSAQPRNRNQAQTTSTGPLTSNTGSSFCYRTDTSGGNSGSPIIDEASGRAVGVHTNGGCTFSAGCNSGTGLTQTQFLAALRAVFGNDHDQPQRIAPPVASSTFGEGCAGSNGRAPAVAVTARPDDRALVVELSGAAPSATALLLVGRNAHTWQGGPLPQALASLGMPGCHLYVGPQASLAAATTAEGSAAASLPLPNAPWLAGEGFAFQWLVRDLAANPAGAVASNAAQVELGG